MQLRVAHGHFPAKPFYIEIAAVEAWKDVLRLDGSHGLLEELDVGKGVSPREILFVQPDGRLPIGCRREPGRARSAQGGARRRAHGAAAGEQDLEHGPTVRPGPDNGAGAGGRKGVDHRHR